MALSAFASLANSILGKGQSSSVTSGSSQAIVSPKVTYSTNVPQSVANMGAVNAAKAIVKSGGSGISKATRSKITTTPNTTAAGLPIIPVITGFSDDSANQKPPTTPPPTTPPPTTPPPNNTTPPDWWNTAPAWMPVGIGAGALLGGGLSTGDIATDTIYGGLKGAGKMAGLSSLEAIGAAILGAMGINYGVKAFEKGTGWNVPMVGYSGAELRAMKRKRHKGINLKYSELKALNSVKHKMKRFDKAFNTIGYDVQKKVVHHYEGGKRK